MRLREDLHTKENNALINRLSVTTTMSVHCGKDDATSPASPSETSHVVVEFDAAF